MNHSQVSHADAAPASGKPGRRLEGAHAPAVVELPHRLGSTDP
ncbi:MULTISPECIES: hypothetical protein [unclassified Streptomyces]|nr:hypothetical protein [Streptomyces sp. NBC_00228]